MGVGDIGAQAAQVSRNLLTALEAVGAGPQHLVSWTILMLEGQPVGPAMGAFAADWTARPNAPLISVAHVSSLAHPDFLIEVSAVAVLPGSAPGR